MTTLAPDTGLKFHSDITSLPPCNIEAEESILGGILLDPKAFDRIKNILRPEAFYVSAHEKIYRAAQTLNEKGQPTDLMTVTSQLRDKKELDSVGGTGKIAQLVDSTISAVNIDRYAELVMKKFFSRQMASLGHSIVELGYDTLATIEEKVTKFAKWVEPFISYAPKEDPDDRLYANLLERVKAIELKEFDPGKRYVKMRRLSKETGWSIKELQTLFLKHMAAKEFEPMMSFEELCEKYGGEVQKWLVNGFLPRGSFNLIHAIGGVGKTLFAYDLLFHVITGRNWNSYPVSNKPCKALIVQTDERPQATIASLKDRLLAQGFEVQFITRWSLENIPYLLQQLKEYRPDIMLVDSLTSINRYSNSSENDADYARKLYILSDAISEVGTCALFIHHSNKSGDSRGSTSIPAAFDQVLELKRPADCRDWSDTRRELSIVKSRFRSPSTYELDLDPETKSWTMVGKKDRSLSFDGEARDAIIELLDANRGTVYEAQEIAYRTSKNINTVRRTASELCQEGLIIKLDLNGDGKRKRNGYFLPDDNDEKGYRLGGPIAEFKEPIAQPEEAIAQEDAIASRSQVAITSKTSDGKENSTCDHEPPIFDRDSGDESVKRSDRAITSTSVVDIAEIGCDHDLRSRTDHDHICHTETAPTVTQPVTEVNDLGKGDRVKYVGDDPGFQRAFSAAGKKYVSIYSIRQGNAELDCSAWGMSPRVPLKDLERVGKAKSVPVVEEAEIFSTNDYEERDESHHLVTEEGDWA
ncbi:AAA family ATPase [Lusitaniella coriacea LEGE 07157]|uniref:AAA family ATPase n=1 Tax=Lusitaniella coriacea LEGE 07157 TaxID=945747 RepID=A0A8J7E0M6_9CYAN|nr:DnaB-like helicase N-terminal domain-containing protein [Lusitaniella coriacea]MBE9119182.1 AAA family ATPase [Lusitaniella coriacea LEGE 07157]